MKKILALALALMMVFSLAITAFAAEAQNGPFSVTIKNATGHTYKIYQIFTGDLATKDGTEILSNIRYGTDYVPEGKAVGDDAVVPDNPTSIVPTGTGTAMTTTGDTATAAGLVAGYYMIQDTTATDSLPNGDTSSAVMFQVVGNTEITSKHTGTTIVKKTQDINDSTGEQPKDGNSVWIDSADYDIGDKVPFQSTAHFEGMANYDTYKVVFTDIMAEGLAYNNDMTITVNGQSCTTGYTIDVTENYTSDDEYNGGTKIVITFETIKDINGTVNDAEIVLNYSATLDTDANFGALGNPNKIKATTMPNGEGEKDTPWDVNIIFTYKVNVDKYAESVDGNKLNGANFTLYKEVPAGTKGAVSGADIKKSFAPNVKANALADAKHYIVVSNKTGDVTGSTFGFTGVDDGNYVLVETTVPAGYNAWDAVAFAISAVHDIIADKPTLTTLTGGNLVSGEFKDTGIIDADIINKAGAVLPETGGIGTTIFYVVGGILVVAAIVLLVTKKRMSSAK